MDERSSGSEADPGWTSFFSDRESSSGSILTDFSWSCFPSDSHRSFADAAAEFDPIAFDDGPEFLQAPDDGGVAAAASSPTAEKSAEAAPSVSSSSSEEAPPPPGNLPGSVGKPAEAASGRGRKKGQKRVRQPRFAFMTKSDVDHLEDGYRWRKYGQKAVKNSPFPRSYYRCTNSKCTVKKRVERSSEDPSIVITTYEGQHCHHTIGFSRGTASPHDPSFGAATGRFLGTSSTSIPQQFHYPSALNFRFGGTSLTNASGQPPFHRSPHQGLLNNARPLPNTTNMASQLATDEGLLDDIVPATMRSTSRS